MVAWLKMRLAANPRIQFPFDVSVAFYLEKFAGRYTKWVLSCLWKYCGHKRICSWLMVFTPHFCRQDCSEVLHLSTRPSAHIRPSRSSGMVRSEQLDGRRWKILKANGRNGTSQERRLFMDISSWRSWATTEDFAFALRAWICSYKQNWWLWSWFLIIYHLPDFIRDLKCFMHIFMFDMQHYQKQFIKYKQK